MGLLCEAHCRFSQENPKNPTRNLRIFQEKRIYSGENKDISYFS